MAPMTPKFLAFAGSLRRESYNKRLVRNAAAVARAAGAEVTLLDLADHPMPLFDEDLEKRGTPEPATRFKRALVEHQGLLLSCPEYNSSITGVLKNAIDWASRPAPGEAPLVAFRGKVVALFAASPGALGGLRGLVHVRAILGNLGMIVLPDQLAVPRAHEAFDDGDRLAAEPQQSQLEAICRRLLEVTRALQAG
jgi:NAD(P)H-dependent FMN reductase